MVELCGKKETIQGCKQSGNAVKYLSCLKYFNRPTACRFLIPLLRFASTRDTELTCPVYFLFVDNVFRCVREEDGIVLGTKIHPNEVGRGSSDGQDDVFLCGEVEGDSSHSQLTGEQQKLADSCKQRKKL